MKIILKNLLNFIQYRYRQSAFNNDARQKIKYLKSKHLLNNFPFEKVTPLVSNYPYFSQSDKLWMDFFFSVYGKAIQDFIPLNIYYQVIEPSLNNYILLQGIKEKNFYNKFFTHIKTPKTLLRRINGYFYDDKYNPIIIDKIYIKDHLLNEHQLIIKPSIESGGGKSIMKFCNQNNSLISNDTVLDYNFLLNYSNDFIIQYVVKQHPYFRQFNPESNNTLRIFTYRSVITDQVHVLHALLRIGKIGEFMDHDNLGGVALAINKKGFLNKYACDVKGRKVDSFNGITFSSVDRVPFMDNVYSISTDLANQIYYARLLAFDFTINEDGDILLVEINCQGNGVSQYQMNNGSLFGEFTKEILDFCQQIKNN